MRKNKIYKLVSAFIDNELEDKEINFVLDKIQNDLEWKNCYEEILKTKQIFSDFKKIKPNEKLQNKILIEINRIENFENPFIPIPKKYIPFAITLVAAAIVFFVVFLFQKKDTIEYFLQENTKNVRTIYENTIANNDLFPLRSSLSKDDVFRFAVYGVLPADTTNEQLLKISYPNEKKFYVELKKDEKNNNYKKELPLNEFYKQVNITTKQKNTIDSILEKVKINIETSILASQKDYLAINPELWVMRDAIFYEISKNLNSKQKNEFFAISKIPHKKNVLYENFDITRLRNVFEGNKIPKKDYIFFKPDTIFVKKVNIDSLKVVIENNKKNVHIIKSRANRLFSQYKNNNVIKIVFENNEGEKDAHSVATVSFSSDKNMLRIEIPDLSSLIKYDIKLDSFYRVKLKNHYKNENEMKRKLNDFNHNVIEFEFNDKSDNNKYLDTNDVKNIHIEFDTEKIKNLEKFLLQKEKFLKNKDVNIYFKNIDKHLNSLKKIDSMFKIINLDTIFKNIIK
ncbi:MAG TPA: hypothetical protein VIR55_13360 [Ignavibacteria bacterium]